MEHTYGRIEYCTSKILSMASQALEVHAFEEQQLINELTDAFETLRKRLLSLVFNEADPRRIEICIQHLQRQLLYLADKLDQAYQNLNTTNSKSRQHKTLIEVVCQKIEQALTMLEENFSRYINMQELVSSGYRIKFQQDLELCQQQLQPLLRRLNLNKSYIEMLGTAASTMSEKNISRHLTYHTAAYLKRLYRDISILVKELSPKDAMERINEFLVGMNFNAPFFINYITISIKESVLNAESDQEKSTILQCFQKTVAQYAQTTSTPYFPALPGARDGLLNWLQHELNYPSKSLPKIKPASTPQPPSAANIVFKSKLSVEELGALFRVLFDNGILQCRNKTKMFQALSQQFKTQEAPVISPGSFGNNFYTVNAKTAKTIKDLMLDLSNDTRRFM